MKALVVVVLVACGSKAQEMGNGSATPEVAARGPGHLLWLEPPPVVDSGDAPPLPQMEPDRWMLMDVATQHSIDVGPAPLSHIIARNTGGDAAYFSTNAKVVRVREHAGKVAIETIAETRGQPTLIALAPDGSTAASYDDGVCVVKPGAKGCIATIALPGFERALQVELAYAGPNRIVATSAEGKQDANAVGMGMHVRAAVVDLTSKRVASLDVPAIWYALFVSPDGRIAWNETANGRLLLSVADLDDVRAKKTYDLGIASAQSAAECAWRGERIACVVRLGGALVSIDTRHGSMTTLVAENAFPKDFIVSADGRSIIFATTDGNLGNFQWFISPLDHAGDVKKLALDERARPLAWF